VSAASLLLGPPAPFADARGPLASAEFVAVDTETNGRGGETCEMTEVGAVLVGGGELHDRFESLVSTVAPLSGGIQRFTGISQAMVDAAPAPESVLPRLAALLHGRVLVAHNAAFDVRVLRQAFDRAQLRWPEPPVLCTVAMARRFAPLVRQRSLGPLAGSLGIEPEGDAHRALVDAETCGRVFAALFPRLCAQAGTVEEGVAVLASKATRRRRSPPTPSGRRRPTEERPDLGALPDDPGVYVFRDVRGRPLYVGKSVAVRSRARSHFCRPAGWTGQAEVVDYRPTHSELGALVLENRLIKEWKPPGNVKLKRADGHVFLRARLDIPYPILDVASEPAAGRAVNVGPLRGRRTAEELADQLASLFGLRHCGRPLPRRDHPSAYGQMDRCLSPCLGDLDPNLYRRRLDEALALFDGSGDGGEALLGHIEARMADASSAQRYERAAALRRRRDRLAGLLGRLDGVLQATHARSRLVLAPHPSKAEWDAFWIVAGRVVDWGPLPSPDETAERTAAALARRPGERTMVPAAEVDEVRLVAGWLAGHDAPFTPLERGMEVAQVTDFTAEVVSA
jgi:DNA polymerase-3 subunit epsilon